MSIFHTLARANTDTKPLPRSWRPAASVFYQKSKGTGKLYSFVK